MIPNSMSNILWDELFSMHGLIMNHVMMLTAEEYIVMMILYKTS